MFKKTYTASNFNIEYIYIYNLFKPLLYVNKYVNNIIIV